MVKCSEPPPEFKWVHPKQGEMSTCADWSVLYEEYQGGATTTLVINRASVEDAGTYTLEATNR